jgi:hypothetical protein
MKQAEGFRAFGRGVVAALSPLTIAATVLLADVRPAAAQADNVTLIREIYLARTSDFASVQGQVAENEHGKPLQQGIARPFHMKCRIAPAAGGLVYRCTSRTSDFGGLSDDDAKLLYASVQAALRAACPEITSWSQGQNTSASQELLGAASPGAYVATAALISQSGANEADDASVDFAIYANPIVHDPLAAN